MDIISFGSVFLELVFGHVNALPLPGEEVFTQEFALSCGGAVTSATAAADAGAQTGVCTVLGDDFGSRVVMAHCAAHGVDLSLSQRVSGACVGITAVLNFDGDRAFITHLPAAGQQERMGHWREVLRRERPAWCYVHVSPGLAGFLREARALGTKVALDMTLTEAHHLPMVRECVELADIFVPNEAELRRLTGADATAAAVAAAAAWGTPLVVKRGAAGALIADGGTVSEVPDGVQRVRVRDLTGAGEAFAGAMLAALSAGAPLAAAVVAANAAGSRTVSRLGAVGDVDLAGISATGWPPRQPCSGTTAGSGGVREDRGTSDVHVRGAVGEPRP